MTSEQIKQLSLYICRKHPGFITPHILEIYFSKTEQELLAFIGEEKQAEVGKLTAQKSEIETKISELNK